MSNQHFFDIPFAFSGDVTAIPDPLQTGGTVSFTEGWNYNYQRNLSTDPAALPIDRSTMNWLFLQITTAIQALQKETVPEWITAAQNGGVAVSYGLGSVVLYSTSGSAPFTKFVSVIAANTNTPSTSDVLGTTTGWQVVCDPIATSAQASAGTDNASIMTPLLVAQQTALRALLAGNATQVFNVGTATASTHAVPLAQAQAMRRNYSAIYVFNSNTTATNVIAGALIMFYGSTTNQGYSLPAWSTMTNLNEVTLFNTGSVSFVVLPNGTDTILTAAGAKTSITVQPGDDLVLAVPGSGNSGQWFAVSGSALRQFNPLVVAAATAATNAVQLSQLQASQGNYLQLIALGTNQTLTVAQLGSAIQWFGASGGILTLPSASTIGSGKTYKIFNYGSGTLIINVAGGSDYFATGTSITTITLGHGDDIELVGRSSLEIDVVGGSAARQFNPLIVGAATAATHAVQLQQAQAMRGTVVGMFGYNATTTLTSAVGGGTVQWSGTTAGTLTLPAQSTMTAQQTVTFYNTGSAAVTIARNGTDIITGLNGATSVTLQPGDDLTLLVKAPAGSWDAIEGSALRQFNPLVVAAATTGAQAMQLQQATGRLLNVRYITATGTYTPTAGTNSIEIELIGGGGGGGGSALTAGGQAAVGSSGYGGGYARKRFTSGFSGVTVTIGAGGAGGTAGNNNGGNGGTSTFGTATPVVCTGGAGGNGGAVASSFPSLTGTGGTVGAASGGDLNMPGMPTGFSICYASNLAVSAPGGNSVLGGGAVGALSTTSGGGVTAGTYGAGGSGAASDTTNANAKAGGAGGQGICIIREYS